MAIVERKEIYEKTLELVLGLEDSGFVFTAGQYIRVTVPQLLHDDPRGPAREFSIASSPNNKKILTIAFRASESGFKQTLSQAPLGTIVDIEGPYGVFTLPQDTTKPIVFIAGGIGITPFMSMVRFATEEKLSHKITLLYANKDEKCTAYFAELEMLEKQNPNFKMERKFGHIDTEFIRKNIQNIEESSWYISGPPTMVDSVKDMIVFLGASDENIYFEESSDLILSDINRLVSIITTSSDGIALTDLRGVIKYVNPAWENLTGWRAEEVIGKVTSRIIKSGKYSREFYENLWSTIMNGQVFRGELTNKKKDETFYDTDEIIFPLRNAMSGIIGFAAFQRDITECKRIQEEILESAQFSENIIRSMADSLIVVTPEAKIKEINQAALDLLGYQRKELVGQPIEQIFGRAAAAEAEAEAEEEEEEAVLRGAGLEKLIKEGAIKDKEMTYQTKQGKEIPVSISGSVIKNEQGELIDIVIVAKDMRVSKKIEKEKRRLIEQAAKEDIRRLREIDKMKDEFLNIATHELKTPLTSIVGLSEIVMNQKNSLSPEQNNYLEIIHEEGVKLSHIMKRILTVTRFESGKETVSLEKINLATFMPSLLPTLNVLAQKTKSKVVSKIKDKDLVVNTDKEKVSEVIDNFVDNAVKYGLEGQTITIATRRENNYVRIEVVDHGKGISPNEQNRLFSKFSQLEPSLSRSREGTGLGLYICKLILDKLGGKIGVESSPGKGSTFYFTLPLHNSKNK